MDLRFAEFAYDRGGRQLLRDGRPVHLSPKAFDLLGLLLARRPRAVSREEVLDALWPGTFVGRSSVAQLVNEVRRALEDDPRRPRFLRTVHRFGYAWLAGPPPEPDTAAAEESPFRLLWGTTAIRLRQGDNALGRAPDALVQIPSAKVSRRHALIRVTGGCAEIEDLGSRNGTYVGGTRIAGRVALGDGDEIAIGPAVLVFVAGGDHLRATESD